ncbi:MULTISPECIES: alpha/beta hydrolase [Ectothiorhodospira]|uniref:alpha/beta hydrolase n=1 Tax=Ectothiorhodospira TaxID=1051 RepID=UPI001EE89E2C|nr:MULTISPECIES: alpha/beta-hydrolase family protein [Ectothiorhodospira]MCG5494967.1 alpha/beta-hydrolase family protein [Ectothiorhodospira variabilis]MCG5504480.1 alpha/beta-hydrolase family protein [Ectothiorhodospira variabilis]MCG5507654.1 alpha/beta-hydrolase family protein [Ectothiorhodospira variabilis]MCG5523813.1 alpha/beta-hydrolase family protein [Ectothiorhodospira haloalkaliphila]
MGVYANRLARLWRQFSVVGLLVGTLFFAFSLTPSLVPRPFLVQGLISGLSFTAGYAVGFFGRWLWSYVELPVPGPRVDWVIKILATVICSVVAVTFLWQAGEWQNALRALMEMEEAGGVQPVSVGLMTLVVFVILLTLARLFKHTFRFLALWLGRYIPQHVSNVVGVLVAAALFWSVIDGVIFSLALRAADNSYQQVDALIEDELTRPTDPLKAGSVDSYVDWRDLGRQGRNFVSSGPRASDLSEFFGENTMEPIRIYVGLNAAETAEERADLALRELKRVNAFERSVLLLVTPTGTGWVDPAALNPVEYLHRGDIATVTAQYSYLPSALSLMVEGEYGAEMARALFEKVYGHWSSLPADERPRLYLHGLSLGALNSDRSFDIYDVIQDPFHGALWSGPPFRSETWRKATRERDPGTPAWLPSFRDGDVVRFMNQHQGLDRYDGEWGAFRIAYLQHASDPITFFDPESFYREPEWIREPRGPDVSPDLRWYPIVTMLQLAADMAAGSTPAGFGHTFAASDYIDAWRVLTEPEGWSESDIERLRALFSD